MKTDLFCQGCGVNLQTEDEEALGFIPSTSLDKGNYLCRRCFQLRHYNKHESVPLTSDDFLTMINAIHDESGLVVHIIDLFDVNGTLLKNLKRIVGNKPIILVGNKVDLLPKSTNHKKLKDWLYSLLKNEGLKVVDIYLISSIKGHNIEELAMRIETERKNQNVFIVGVTNVGKSTFINQIILRSTGLKDELTTSYIPGTTLGFIEIPLDEKSSLIDTPGIINKNQMAHFVTKAELKTITPRKEIKSRNYQLNSEQTLFIGGLVRFDFIKGHKQTFVCYFANELPIHRTKLANADQLYDKQKGELLQPPTLESLENLPPMVKQSYRIKEANTDIVIAGLGWITVITGNITVDVHCPKGVAVNLRKSFN